MQYLENCVGVSSGRPATRLWGRGVALGRALLVQVALALTLLGAWVGPALADPSPSVSRLSAPLVTPSQAWTHYGVGQTHSNSAAAWTQRPPEVQALARGLGADRLAAGEITSSQYAQNVFDYVRNNIDTEFRFGLSKGARGALIDQSGTPFDQAHLMVELLRQAGMSAGYRVGTITLDAQQFGQWTGLVTNLTPATPPALPSFTVGAQAACQLLADGGVPALVNGAASCEGLSGNLTTVTLGHIWVAANGNLYDPSFKRYNLRLGIDAPAIMGCGTQAAPTCGSAVTSAAMSGAVSGTLGPAPTLRTLNEAALGSQLQTYAGNLENNVSATLPDAPIEDVIGGEVLDDTYAPTPSASLPYASAEQYSWAGDIPDQFRTKFRAQGAGFDVTFYADEIDGRRLRFQGNWLIGSEYGSTALYLDNQSIATASSQIPGASVTFGIDVPFVANAGGYGDYSQAQSQLVGPASSMSIVAQWGEVGEGRVRHFADLDLGDHFQHFFFAVEDTGAQESRLSSDVILAAQWGEQFALARRIAERAGGARIEHHYSVGWIEAGAMSFETRLGITSASNNASSRDASLEAVAALGAVLEGSVGQQQADSWNATSAIGSLSVFEEGGGTLVHVTSANWATVAPLLQNYQAQTLSRLSQAAALGFDHILPADAGVWGLQQIPSSGLLAVNTTSEASIGFRADAASFLLNLINGVQKGGSTAPTVEDPMRAALASADRNDEIPRPTLPSVDPGAGNLTITPPPDLTTGAGGFPYSLSFQRTYSSANGVGHEETYDGKHYPVPWTSPTSGPDAQSRARLGGGWSHNFQITAQIQNDGVTGLGARRGLDAVAAIAGIHALLDSYRNPSFQRRVAAALAAQWVGRQFINNVVTLQTPPTAISFARLPSGNFLPPLGAAGRLAQSGARAGPYFTDTTGTSAVYDYAAVSLSYTDEAGGVIALTPGESVLGVGPGSQVNASEAYFVADTWTFAQGLRISFGYTNFDIGNNNVTGLTRRARALTSVSNNLGRSLTFQLEAYPTPSLLLWPFPSFAPRITRVTDETGRFVQIQRNCPARGAATPNDLMFYNCATFEVVTPDGGRTIYAYEPTASSPNPAVTTRATHRLRRVFTPTDATTPYSTIAYDGLFRVSSLTDALAHGNRYFIGGVRDEDFRRSTTIDAEGVATTGNPSDGVTIHEFRRRGRLVTDALGQITATTLDDAGRVVRVINPEGDGVSRTYDRRSNLLTETREPRPGSGLTPLVTTFSYGEDPTVLTCANYRICNQISQIDGPRTDVTDIANFTWDPTWGVLTRAEQPADSFGLRPQVDYGYSTFTPQGVQFRLLTSITEKISATQSVVTNYAYNSANRYVLQSATVDPGGLNLVTALTFDSVGNLTQADGPRSDVADLTNFTWDANRRLRMRISADPDGAGSLPRTAERLTYNLDGAVIAVEAGTTTLATGANFVASETTAYAYDAGRNRTRTTTPAGVTQFSYDGDNRLRCTALRMNAAVYGSLPSDACALSDGSDRITQLVYDNVRRVEREIRALGIATPAFPQTLQQDHARYTYSPNGLRRSVRDANDNRSAYVYDGFGRLCRLYFPVSAAGQNAANTGGIAESALTCASGGANPDYEGYAYDGADNRTDLRLRSGETIALEYDALNREIRRTIPDTPVNDPSNDVFFAYDLLDRRLYARFGAGGAASATCAVTSQGVDYCYDRAGRLLTENAYGRALAYQYDPASNRTRITYPAPDTNFIQYTFDAMNRMDQVRENGATSGAGLLADYGYDSLGRRALITRGNGTATTISYDGASRLASLAHDLAATAADLSTTFTYNPASQLLTRNVSNDLYRYPVTSRSAAWTASGLNTISPTSGSAYVHDARGNLINDGTRRFCYDLENRLVGVAPASTNPCTSPSTISLAYDPLGRLRETSAASVATQFLYDGDRLLGEYNSVGTLLRRYVHGAGLDEPLVWYEGASLGDRRWLHSDHQGTVIGVTTAAGALSGSPMSYGPWGEPDAASGWTGSRFRYTGQIMLSEAQLYHYKARVYDPGLGRFLQTDPVGYEDQLNLYAYVYNDPLNNNDPTGRCGPLTLVCAGAGGGCAVTGPACPVGAVVGAVVGGVVTGVVIIGGIILMNENADTPADQPDPDAPSGLGDLTNGEVGQIQGVVDAAGRPIAVVGSAAGGTRGEGSDIDYVAGPSSLPNFEGQEGNLPGIDAEHGIIPGVPNPHQGPAIQFEPGAPPKVIPAEPPPPPRY